jgi:hypothetical protein
VISLGCMVVDDVEKHGNHSCFSRTA